MIQQKYGILQNQEHRKTELRSTETLTGRRNTDGTNEHWGTTEHR